MKLKQKGFTLIELLVVIAIIGLLASVIFVALGNARVKARDAKRAADMRQILLALNLFYDKNGCLPVTYGGTACQGATGYLENDFVGYDYSSQGGFLTFLQTAGFVSKAPVDPINNTVGAGGSGSYTYRYYCYPLTGPILNYWRESDNTSIFILGSLGTGESNYICK